MPLARWLTKLTGRRKGRASVSEDSLKAEERLDVEREKVMDRYRLFGKYDQY